MLPTHITMVDAVSDILHVSSDSAYRRIRGETPLVLGEVRQLCNHFNLSLDQLLNVKTGSVLFQDNISTHYEPWQAICQYGPDSKDPEKLANEKSLCRNPST